MNASAASSGSGPSFWLVAPVVAMAAFMEVLDISIANVALPHIAGSLASSQDEATWVLTSYLVANAIVLTITGWLSKVFERKRLFLFCIAGFGVASLLCGMAPTLGALVCFRALQGLMGGGLQPFAQAILSDAAPPSKRGIAFALYGIAVVFAPAIGPTLGGNGNNDALVNSASTRSASACSLWGSVRCRWFSTGVRTTTGWPRRLSWR